MATEVEVLGERLLRGFNEEALGNTVTVVIVAEAARRAVSITALRTTRRHWATSWTPAT
jgi:hypothetical protein